MRLLLFTCVAAFAQSPSFEVASVKLAAPLMPGQRLMRGGPGSNEPGRVTFTSVNLQTLIMRAYDVWTDQVAGPAWLADFDKNVYAVIATMPADTSPAQFRVMLQTLLVERFQLRLHHEAQTRPGYDLITAEGGPKLQEWTPPKQPIAYERGQSDGSGFASLDPNIAGQTTFVVPMSGGRGPVRISERATISRFCRSLAAYLNASRDHSGAPLARIVDKTGLAGIYDYRFEFTGTMLPTASAPVDPTMPPIASDPGPTLFSAIEKQLGLKLVKAKDVSVDVLVVDHAEKIPSEN